MHDLELACTVWIFMHSIYSSTYSLGDLHWRHLLSINTRDSPFRHKEPRVWDEVGWMDNGVLIDVIPKMDSELLTQMMKKTVYIASE